MPENPSFAETQRSWMKGGGKKVLNIHFKCNARCGMDMWNSWVTSTRLQKKNSLGITFN